LRGEHMAIGDLPPSDANRLDRERVVGLGFPAAHARVLVSRAVRFEHVLVVGAGQMGGGIAQVVAASGRRVSLHDPYPGAVERGLATRGKSLAKLAEKGGADPEQTLARVTAVDELVPADLMIEAIVEDALAKGDFFPQAVGGEGV